MSKTAIDKIIEIVEGVETKDCDKAQLLQMLSTYGKKLEKQQIIDAFESGYENGALVQEGESIYHGHNYYNLKFKDNEQNK